MRRSPLIVLVATVLLSSVASSLAHAAPGDLYAANFGNNTIERFTPGGVASVFASTGLSGPTGLAFDGSGNFYAANAGNNTIERFTLGGVASVFASNRPCLPAGWNGCAGAGFTGNARRWPRRSYGSASPYDTSRTAFMPSQ